MRLKYFHTEHNYNFLFIIYYNYNYNIIHRIQNNHNKDFFYKQTSLKLVQGLLKPEEHNNNLFNIKPANNPLGKYICILQHLFFKKDITP